MALPYTLGGELVQKMVKLTYTDNSEVGNVYLFKVPHSLIEETKSLSSGDYQRNAHVGYLINQAESEWKPFVNDLELPCSITSHIPPSFSMPAEPFREMTTTSGIKRNRSLPTYEQQTLMAAKDGSSLVAANEPKKPNQALSVALAGRFVLQLLYHSASCFASAQFVHEVRTSFLTGVPWPV